MLELLAWTAACGGVAAAGALAAVRLGDPRPRRLVEVVTLVPLGLPLAVVGALAALVLLVLSARHRLSGLVFVVALALAAAHTWWIAPLYVGGTVAAGPGSVVVMSLNFEVGDPGELAETVVARHVDVLVLLEMSRERLVELRATGLTGRLSHVAGDAGSDAIGTVVLSRFPLAGAPTAYADADSLVVDLDVPATGTATEQVTVVAVHTRPPYHPAGWRSDHERILGVLSHLPGDGAVLLAGDFNATLEHAPMRRILDLGFRDAADQVGSGWSPTWPAAGHVSRLGIAVPAFAPIDHVLTSRALAVTAEETLEVAGADHLAVLASVSPAA